MSIGAAEIEVVARLARIRIEPADVARHAAEISRILDYVAAMNEIDTTGVEPLAASPPSRSIGILSRPARRASRRATTWFRA